MMTVSDVHNQPGVWIISENALIEIHCLSSFPPNCDLLISHFIWKHVISQLQCSANQIGVNWLIGIGARFVCQLKYIPP